MELQYQVRLPTVKDIENSEIVKDWWRRINASDNTKKHYVRGLTYFLRFIIEKDMPLGHTPEDLIEYATEKIREDVLKWRNEIEGVIASYKEWLSNKKKILKGGEHLSMRLAPKTIQDYVAAVKSFYNAFNIDVPKNKGRNVVKPLVENNRRLTKEMLKEALKYADIREKAIILTMVSSGMGDSEILNLKVGDFIRGRGYNPQKIQDISSWIIEERKRCENEIKNGNLDYGITMLEIRRKKTQVDYITFLTPEATMAVLDYLAWRNRKSTYSQRYKGIGKIREEKRKVRGPDDYLFIRKYIDDWYLPPEIIEKLKPARVEAPTDKKSKATKAVVERVKKKREELGLKGYADEVRKLDRKGLMAMFRDLAKKAGLSTKFGVYQVLRGHNLRKLFYTLLRNEGVDSFIIEYWMGHKIPAEQEAYFQSIPEKLKMIYKKHLYALTMEDVDTKILESEEYKEIKEKLEIYEEALKKRNGEIRKLREEIEKLKRREERREPLDELMSKLMSDPEVQEVIKRKIKELGLI